MSAVAALLIAALHDDAPATNFLADRPHALDVRAFASTLAVTKMASHRCGDILINRDLVRQLGELAHYDRVRDSPALAAEARAKVVL